MSAANFPPYAEKEESDDISLGTSYIGRSGPNPPNEMLSLSRMTETLPHGGPRSGDIHNPSRQPTWNSTPFGRIGGSTSQRSSPGGNDLTPTRLSFERLNIDQRPFGVHDDYHLPLSSFSSTTTIDSSALTPLGLTRSAPDNSRSFGNRFARSTTYNVHAPEGPGLRQEHEDNMHCLDANLQRGSRSSRPSYRSDATESPVQLLPLPLPEQLQNRDRPLMELPVNLSAQEQEDIAQQTNDILSDCAFHFVARYQFPIQIEPQKPWVRQASDRDWTEWAYLLKKLATKRRIPARVLFEGQIKQFVTTLENSIVVRHSPSTRADIPPPNRLRDDRYMLQLLSSALQVAKILQDAVAMQQLNDLYIDTEATILSRRRVTMTPGAIGIGRGGRDVHGGTIRPIGSGIIGGSVIGRGHSGAIGGVGSSNTGGY